MSHCDCENISGLILLNTMQRINARNTTKGFHAGGILKSSNARPCPIVKTLSGRSHSLKFDLFFWDGVQRSSNVVLPAAFFIVQPSESSGTHGS